MKDEPLRIQLIQTQDQLQDSLSVDMRPLVCEIVKLRSLCRPPSLALNVPVFLEIFTALQIEICDILTAQLQSYDGDHPTIRQWSVELIHQACREILSDPRLKEIALFAQSTEPKSQPQYIAFTEMLESIRLSGKLATPHRGKFSAQFYALLYEEALNQTFIYICQKIHLYDPNRSARFMTWVNFRLDKMLIEARRAFSGREQQDLPDLNDLERIPQQEIEESLADTVQSYIRDDPEGLFQSTHIRKRPDVSFQAIALARFQGRNWEELSIQFQIKVPTLSSFFQRSCQKFAPIFQSQCL